MFSRGLMESFKQGAAFGGEAVFLQAAVGFFGDGALDEVGGKGRVGDSELQSFRVHARPERSRKSETSSFKLHPFFDNGGDVGHGEKRVEIVSAVGSVMCSDERGRPEGDPSPTGAPRRSFYFWTSWSHWMTSGKASSPR